MIKSNHVILYHPNFKCKGGIEVNLKLYQRVLDTAGFNVLFVASIPEAFFKLLKSFSLQRK